MPWAFWVLLFGTALGAPPSVDQIRCWIGQLDSHDFAVCAEASRNLADAGDAAVEALLSSAGKADAEAAWRATGVLEQIALRGNECILRRVTIGLQELARGGKPGFEGIVEELQTRQARLQREHAVATIRSLGGRFEADEKATAPLVAKSASAAHGDSKGAVEPPPEATGEQSVSTAPLSIPVGVGFIGDAFVSSEFLDGTERQEPESVITIDDQWRGGDAGLAALHDLGNTVRLRFQRAPLTDAALEHIASIPQLQSVEMEDCRFSAEALAKLREWQPRTQIVVRGK
jgi:hypothetical protein